MRRLRVAGLLSLYLALVVGGLVAGHGLLGIVEFDIRPSNEALVHEMIMSATAVFVLASSVPFVPGAEIGFALIVALGPPIVVLVYLSMVLALLLSYLLGRFVPAKASAALFGLLGLRRAHDLVLRMAPLDPDGRIALLTDHAPRRLVPFLLRHRHLALAVVLNVPGNTLLGGGGGLALAAGMSGLYRLPAYVATIMLAVAPLPLLVLLTGHMP